MKTKIILILEILSLGMIACNKESNKAHLRVLLTDAPADMDSVIVEINSVEINIEGEAWVTLDTESGLYNLLELQNNVTVVLNQDQAIPAGKLNQMRLILGSENYVVIGGVQVPMETPSANQTGLKININTEIPSDSVVEIVLDFDAEKSIVATGNGKLILSPVIVLSSININ